MCGEEEVIQKCDGVGEVVTATARRSWMVVAGITSASATVVSGQTGPSILGQKRLPRFKIGPVSGADEEWSGVRLGHNSGKRIGMGPCFKNGATSAEMLFRCRACSRTSELLGWVKDAFQHCAPSWDEAFIRELQYVSRIFQRREDMIGPKLFWKCTELVEKLKSGMVEPMACNLNVLPR
ncbi:Protein OBERON 1 [Abeliophyllum distichum]|uniref:Protein OBERON 1 n=1 Tax=Abeliophyllum distichum TaxID=126358 RepID=A0ABD1UI00_9LAMI